MNDDKWRATTSDEYKHEPTKQQSTKVRIERIGMTVRVSDWERDEKYEHTNSITVRTLDRHRLLSFVQNFFLWPSCDARGACHFFLKFLVRACKRAITAIRTYGTTAYVVCYTGRSTTNNVRIFGKTVLDPSGSCTFIVWWLCLFALHMCLVFFFHFTTLIKFGCFVLMVWMVCWLCLMIIMLYCFIWVYGDCFSYLLLYFWLHDIITLLVWFY